MKAFLQKHIREKYASSWNDFVSIQIDLLHGKLRHLFENTLNVDKNTLNQFYKHFSCNRMYCITLPNNGDDSNVARLYDLDVWIEMIEKFDGDNAIRTRRTTRKELEMSDVGNLNHIYTFIVLWNGIFGMMHKRDANYTCGFATAMKKMKFNGCVIETRNELET